MEQVTSHNYLTLHSLENFCDNALPNLTTAHRSVMEKGLVGLERLVQKKYDDQFEGFVKNSMEEALGIICISKSRFEAA